MLNFEVRLFIKVAIQLKTFEAALAAIPESAWPRNADCREELELLRDRLVNYTVGSGELARLKDVHDFFRPNVILKNHGLRR